jgi:hypothetical protein
VTMRGIMGAAGMAVVCLSTCPMVGYKPPVASGGTSAPATSSAPKAPGVGIGHSAGNVAFVPTGQDDIKCAVAAKAAADHFPTAASCKKWVATPNTSARLPLIRDIALGNVPAGTFGPTIVATQATPAGAAYPFTPAAAA